MTQQAPVIIFVRVLLLTLMLLAGPSEIIIAQARGTFLISRHLEFAAVIDRVAVLSLHLGPTASTRVTIHRLASSDAPVLLGQERLVVVSIVVANGEKFLVLSLGILLLI